jgi:hypothetical protein
VDEVGYNIVVAGGFEDRAEHLNKKDYFRLFLHGSDKLFFGTDIEINEIKVYKALSGRICSLRRSGLVHF